MRKNRPELICIGKSFRHGASFWNTQKKLFRNLFWINLRAIHILQLKLSIKEDLKISKTICFTIEIKTLLYMILLLRRSVFENLFVIVDLHDSINRKPLLILFKRFALYWTATFSSGIMASSKLSSDILTSHWHDDNVIKLKKFHDSFTLVYENRSFNYVILPERILKFQGIKLTDNFMTSLSHFQKAYGICFFNQYNVLFQYKNKMCIESQLTPDYMNKIFTKNYLFDPFCVDVVIKYYKSI